MSQIMRITLLLISISPILLSCTQQSSTTLSADTLKSDSSDTVTTTKSPETIQVTQQCAYENEMSDLGVGLIIALSNFEVFNDSLLTDRFAEIKMYENEVAGICPLFFETDYGIMHFVCIGETENAYKVLTGTTDLKYIPKTKTSDVRTWDDYILQSYGIGRKTGSALCQEPLDNSQTISVPGGYEIFCAMEVKGNWLKVKYDCFCNIENNPHEGEPCHAFINECDKPLTGWLKWRDQNKLLIEIFLVP
jgi:hypothetical protein